MRERLNRRLKQVLTPAEFRDFKSYMRRMAWTEILEQRRRSGKRRRRGMVGMFTQSEWGEMVRAAGHRCHYCGVHESVVGSLTMDHVTPVSRGGRHCADNIVPACMPCNLKKSDKILELAGS